MQSRSRFYRFHQAGSFRPENIGHRALALIGNLCFTLFVVGVLIFTIIAATYEPDDPLFRPSATITTFLTSTSSSTFKSDSAVVKTGEDFMAPNQTAFSAFVNISDVEIPIDSSEATKAKCDDSIGCKDPEAYNLMMRKAMELFTDIHFYRFGKPVPGNGKNVCHLAWKFRPKEGKTASFYKDYREFTLARLENCTLIVVKVGDYHSGVNARKKNKNQRPRFGMAHQEPQESMHFLPVVGEVVNDSLPVVDSENSFSNGKYLIYVGGGDRCKNMNHYLWSFLCALGEAQYLNRTFVMDLSVCLNAMYVSSTQDEEGKDFRYYFDFEHLSEAASVLDQVQFWEDWGRWHEEDDLTLHLVEDFRISPLKLTGVKQTLIMRKFGSVEPDNYWYRVCEGETEAAVPRPWHLIWKSRRLMDIVSTITSRLNWDFDAIHVERGEKAKKKELWPNLEQDTSPGKLLSSLGDKIEEGRNVYIATNEADSSYFDILKEKYATHFLTDFHDLWSRKSEWHSEMMKLSSSDQVDFDGYMRASVDTEVFLRGKKQIETFNDLTRDCKDGINTCNLAST